VCITELSVAPPQLLRRVWKIFRYDIRVSPDSLFREMAERITTNAASYEEAEHLLCFCLTADDSFMCLDCIFERNCKLRRSFRVMSRYDPDLTQAGVGAFCSIKF
jgi:beta-galactosidase GanA